MSHYFLGSTADTTSGSFFATAFCCAPPPFLAGDNPNAAREPEVEDLGNLLISMGAKIKGLGTDVIEIEGVAALNGSQYKVMFDRIEAGTYMAAAVVSG